MSGGVRALLIFRSNAEALMAHAALSRGGMTAEVVQNPHGCGYALRLRVQTLESALTLLLARGVPVSRVELQ